MLQMALSISNPFSKGIYANYYNYNGILSGNKLIDINVDRDPRMLLDINLDFSLSRGPSIGLRIFGFGFSIEVHDRREWDYKSSSWQDNKSGS